VRSSALEKERRLEKAAPSREEILTERREVIKKGVYLAGAGALFATTAGSLGAFIPPYVNPFVDGTYDILFSTSGATSAWANDKADQKMKTSDFDAVGPGHGAQGKITELAMNVIVTYLIPDFVAPTMKGTVPYGDGLLAAYNAKCKHLGCTALWRNEQEGKKIANASVFPYPMSHDFIVCPCHLGTYDIYNSAKVMFGPPPNPLDQLRLQVAAGGQVQIKFTKYKYGKNITGGQV
jgi:quinol---cytochrome c reductase iron-sulfur subunit